jgi:hypothetical protein
MGYLTTFTVYNDFAHHIKKDPKQFGEKVYEHICGMEASDFSMEIGNCSATVAIGQQSRHADDLSIYVHMGNCVTEVNPYSRSFEDLVNKSPQFADKLINFIEAELEELKKFKQSTKND